MSALKKGPPLPTWLAAAVIGAALGAGGGFYGANWDRIPLDPTDRRAAERGEERREERGGAESHRRAETLVRVIGILVTVEKTRGRELTAEQRHKLAAVVARLKAADDMSDEECGRTLESIGEILTQNQRPLLAEAAEEEETRDFERPFKAGPGRERLEELAELLKK